MTYKKDSEDMNGMNDMTAEQAKYYSIYISAQHLKAACYGASKEAGWWTDLATGADMDVFDKVPEKLMLIVSEVAEAMEGDRKGLQDDKLPQYSMLRVELCDVLIRTFDLLGKLDEQEGLGDASESALSDKMKFNANRPDHKLENRTKEGGKRY